MRTGRLRFAALAAPTVLTVDLCTGCKERAARPDAGDRSATPSAVSPTNTADTAPRRLNAVLVRVRAGSGGMEVTYRPATVRHKKDRYSEWIDVRPSGPPVSAVLDGTAGVLLCTPLNERENGGITQPEPVTHEAFAAALAEHRDLLPRIGFEMEIGASGRIVHLKEIYQP